MKKDESIDKMSKKEEKMNLGIVDLYAERCSRVTIDGVSPSATDDGPTPFGDLVDEVVKAAKPVSE